MTHAYQLTELIPHYDELQHRYGEPPLVPVYGTGCIEQPDLCLTFMNPTGRNIATHPDRPGLRVPRAGTKAVWQLLTDLDLFDPSLNTRIQSHRPDDWTPAIVEEIYTDIAHRKLYITNLCKATTHKAVPLTNTVYRAYRDAFVTEIDTIQPRAVISFGVQTSSVLLQHPIKLAQRRRRAAILETPCTTHDVYPVYYPVGQGRPQLPKAIEDLAHIRTACGIL